MDLDDLLTQVRNIANELDNLSVVVGFVGPMGLEMYDGVINVATVALYQEFGTDIIPERSFIRSTINERQEEIGLICNVEIAGAIEGVRTPVQAMTNIGETVSKMIKDKAESAIGWATPLAASTIKAKGSSRPLYDSGKMIENIGWGILNKGILISYGRAK